MRRWYKWKSNITDSRLFAIACFTSCSCFFFSLFFLITLSGTYNILLNVSFLFSVLFYINEMWNESNCSECASSEIFAIIVTVFFSFLVSFWAFSFFVLCFFFIFALLCHFQLHRVLCQPMQYLLHHEFCKYILSHTIILSFFAIRQFLAACYFSHKMKKRKTKRKWLPHFCTIFFSFFFCLFFFFTSFCFFIAILLHKSTQTS